MVELDVTNCPQGFRNKIIGADTTSVVSEGTVQVAQKLKANNQPLYARILNSLSTLHSRTKKMNLLIATLKEDVFASDLHRSVSETNWLKHESRINFLVFS